MKILYGSTDIKGKFTRPDIAIGNFDGLHIGHRKVISKLVSGRERTNEKVVMTFDPHPRTVLGKKENGLRIMSLEHRISILERYGVNGVVIVPFDNNVAYMAPSEFIEKFLLPLSPENIYIGANFRFGRGRSGDIHFLDQMSSANRIAIHPVSPVVYMNRAVSSTWLRELISGGKLELSAKLLRRPVSVLGTVVKGDRRGSFLGTPTANIDPHHEVLPPPAVYAVKVRYGGKFYDAVLNIGYKPTFYGDRLKKRKEPVIEAHLFDFKGDLYGSELEIYFIKKIRDELWFENEAQLRSRILKDLELSRNILSDKYRARTVYLHRVK